MEKLIIEIEQRMIRLLDNSEMETLHKLSINGFEI